MSWSSYRCNRSGKTIATRVTTQQRHYKWIQLDGCRYACTNTPHNFYGLFLWHCLGTQHTRWKLLENAIGKWEGTKTASAVSLVIVIGYDQMLHLTARLNNCLQYAKFFITCTRARARARTRTHTQGLTNFTTQATEMWSVRKLEHQKDVGDTWSGHSFQK